MANPETIVTSQTFRLDKVIYNSQGFSIGTGRYQGTESLVLTMRWNGAKDKVRVSKLWQNLIMVYFTYRFKLWFFMGLLQSNDITQENHIQLLEYMKEFKFQKFGDLEVKNKEDFFDDIFPST